VGLTKIPEQKETPRDTEIASKKFLQYGGKEKELKEKDGECAV